MAAGTKTIPSANIVIQAAAWSTIPPATATPPTTMAVDFVTVLVTGSGPQIPWLLLTMD